MTTLTHNDRRAVRIGHILSWCKDWPSERDGLIDLLADARHWCDRNGHCFGELDRLAHQHYLDDLHNQRIKERNAP
jgi:hypothetical protein